MVGRDGGHGAAVAPPRHSGGAAKKYLVQAADNDALVQRFFDGSLMEEGVAAQHTTTGDPISRLEHNKKIIRPGADGGDTEREEEAVQPETAPEAPPPKRYPSIRSTKEVTEGLLDHARIVTSRVECNLARVRELFPERVGNPEADLRIRMMQAQAEKPRSFKHQQFHSKYHDLQKVLSDEDESVVQTVELRSLAVERQEEAKRAGDTMSQGAPRNEAGQDTTQWKLRMEQAVLRAIDQTKKEVYDKAMAKATEKVADSMEKLRARVTELETELEIKDCVVEDCKRMQNKLQGKVEALRAELWPLKDKERRMGLVDVEEMKRSIEFYEQERTYLYSKIFKIETMIPDNPAAAAGSPQNTKNRPSVNFGQQLKALTENVRGDRVKRFASRVKTLSINLDKANSLIQMLEAERMGDHDTDGHVSQPNPSKERYKTPRVHNALPEEDVQEYVSKQQSVEILMGQKERRRVRVGKVDDKFNMWDEWAQAERSLTMTGWRKGKADELRKLLTDVLREAFFGMSRLELLRVKLQSTLLPSLPSAATLSLFKATDEKGRTDRFELLAVLADALKPIAELAERNEDTTPAAPPRDLPQVLQQWDREQIEAYNFREGLTLDEMQAAGQARQDALSALGNPQDTWQLLVALSAWHTEVRVDEAVRTNTAESMPTKGSAIVDARGNVIGHVAPAVSSSRVPLLYDRRRGIVGQLGLSGTVLELDGKEMEPHKASAIFKAGVYTDQAERFGVVTNKGDKVVVIDSTGAVVRPENFDGAIALSRIQKEAEATIRERHQERQQTAERLESEANEELEKAAELEREKEAMEADGGVDEATEALLDEYVEQKVRKKAKRLAIAFAKYKVAVKKDLLRLAQRVHIAQHATSRLLNHLHLELNLSEAMLEHDVERDVEEMGCDEDCQAPQATAIMATIMHHFSKVNRFWEVLQDVSSSVRTMRMLRTIRDRIWGGAPRWSAEAEVQTDEVPLPPPTQQVVPAANPVLPPAPTVPVPPPCPTPPQETEPPLEEGGPEEEHDEGESDAVSCGSQGDEKSNTPSTTPATPEADPSEGGGETIPVSSLLSHRNSAVSLAVAHNVLSPTAIDLHGALIHFVSLVRKRTNLPNKLHIPKELDLQKQVPDDVNVETLMVSDIDLLKRFTKLLEEDSTFVSERIKANLHAIAATVKFNRIKMALQDAAPPSETSTKPKRTVVFEDFLKRQERQMQVSLERLTKQKEAILKDRTTKWMAFCKTRSSVSVLPEQAVQLLREHKRSDGGRTETPPPPESSTEEALSATIPPVETHENTSQAHTRASGTAPPQVNPFVVLHSRGRLPSGNPFGAKSALNPRSPLKKASLSMTSEAESEGLSILGVRGLDNPGSRKGGPVLEKVPVHHPVRAEPDPFVALEKRRQRSHVLPALSSSSPGKG